MQRVHKAVDFFGRHSEFFVGLAVGIAAPAIATKVRGVKLPVKVKANATIQTAA